MRTKLGRRDVTCARKIGMKNKVYGPKDTCMRMKLGRRDVACARKNGMKNKVCGPEGPWYEMFIPRAHLCHVPSNLIFHTTSRQPSFTLMQVSFDPQTLFLIPRPVNPASLSCKHPSAHKPYFSYHFFERMPRPFDPASLSFKCPSAHKPYFSYHVPSTQLRSHVSTLRPTNLISHTTSPVDPGSFSCKHPSGPQTLFLIPRPVDPASLSCKHPSAHKPYFSYHFFERMPRPVDPRSFSCKCPSGPQTLFLIPRPVDPASLSCKYPLAHKPYFSYQLFERMPRPIDSGSFPYKRPLNSNHPVHRTFLI